MYRLARLAIVPLAALLLVPAAAAQTVEVLGTRAAGMGGAFVAVADDASAIYWNPAGLATGAFFSLLIDRKEARSTPETRPEAGSESAHLIALSTPALGLGYYRLRSTTARLPDLSASSGLLTVPGLHLAQVDSLVTHHTGVTLVQSLTDRVAVGATLKLVRGIAAGELTNGPVPEDLLDRGADLIGRASNRFDADLGVIATAGRLKAGLLVRNATQPRFETPQGRELRLHRQVRAGVAVNPLDGLLVAADIDVERVPGPLGDVRNLALGAEGRVLAKLTVRAGLRFNTLDDQPGGRAAVATVGGSYAVLSSVFVDAQATGGSEAGGRGWGVAGRVMF